MLEALDGVAQLAHVARPGVVLELLSLDLGQAVPQRRLGHLVDQQGDVFLAVAQRGQGDGEDRQAEVEVFAEAARLRLGPEVLLRGGDDAGVELVRAPRLAQAAELPILQGAQQLGLEIEREIVDLVEEERAAVGPLEAADALRHRAGEGALLVAEQLGLDQVLATPTRSRR